MITLTSVKLTISGGFVTINQGDFFIINNAIASLRVGKVMPGDAETTDTFIIAMPDGEKIKFTRSAITHYNSSTDIPAMADLITAFKTLLPSSSATITNNNTITTPNVIYNPKPSIWMPIMTDLANITTATAMATNTTYAFYLGKAESAYSLASILFRCVTAGVGTVTWAEIGIAKGALQLNSAPTLTRCGFVNIAGDITGTGTKKKTDIALTGIAAGDDLWICLGGQCATTQWQTRGSIARDENQSGCAATLAGRFSTMSPETLFTLGAANLVHAFCQIKF